MASATGTATVNFGSAPGTNYVEVVVTGQAAISATSHVDAFLMASATADHNAMEHAIVPLRLTCGNVVAGTGFTIYVSTEWRLTGSFTLHWVWAD
jgi:hypothetical protein